MTLKEKFQNIPSDYLPLSNNQKNECEIIADEFAIEFGKWLNNQVINSSGKHHNLLGSTKVTQLLPIFKKEKGL
jgi:hypothetical protein